MCVYILTTSVVLLYYNEEINECNLLSPTCRNKSKAMFHYTEDMNDSILQSPTIMNKLNVFLHF